MIHYHGTPLTPLADMIKSFQGRHAMVSFEAPRQMKVAMEICQSVALDNGAYSAWKKRRPYDFRNYIKWVGKWINHPAMDWCVIPDTIEGGEEENDALLKQWVMPREKSVPVWHMHESLERLQRLASEYPRVALGSSGVYKTPGSDIWWERMNQAMPLVCDENGMPRVKLHGLRMLNPGVFSKLPLSSADSCNVARSVGIDENWKGTYIPHSKFMRALIMMERIERHASASRWNPKVIDSYHNDDLLG